MPEIDLSNLKDGVAQLRADIAELEAHFPHWDSGSTSGGRTLRSIAKRIVLSSNRVEALVRESTYAP